MQASANQNTTKPLNKVEHFVSRSLRVGVLASAMVILLGLLLFISTCQGGYPNNTYPVNLPDIVSGTLALRPFAVILTGLILLILTPVLRVGVSTLLFVKERDWLYVGISSIVFVILLTSFFFGK